MYDWLMGNISELPPFPNVGKENTNFTSWRKSNWMNIIYLSVTTREIKLAKGGNLYTLQIWLNLLLKLVKRGNLLIKCHQSNKYI